MSKCAHFWVYHVVSNKGVAKEGVRPLQFSEQRTQVRFQQKHNTAPWRCPWFYVVPEAKHKVSRGSCWKYFLKYLPSRQINNDTSGLKMVSWNFLCLLNTDTDWCVLHANKHTCWLLGRCLEILLQWWQGAVRQWGKSFDRICRLTTRRWESFKGLVTPFFLSTFLS